MTAMPLKGGTLTQSRTQLNLKCDECRHEWSIEMMPPVLLLMAGRETDRDASRKPQAMSSPIQTPDRRRPDRSHRRRTRVGLCGLLRSADRTQAVAVLYSVDPGRVNGRLRVLDPGSRFPGWLVQGSRLWLYGYDGVPLRVRITAVAPRRGGLADDEQFAEYVIRQPRTAAAARSPRTSA